jgi:hypothetical protein
MKKSDRKTLLIVAFTMVLYSLLFGYTIGKITDSYEQKLEECKISKIYKTT